MPQFSYKARRRSGELVEGVLEVADRPAAVAQIERLGLFPIAVDTSKGAAAGRRQAREPGIRPPVVPAADVARVFRAAAQAEVAGAGHVHAAARQSAPGRHAAVRRAQQHDVSGDQGHPVGREPPAQAGGERGPGVVRRHGQAAARVFGFVCQHGEGGRVRAARWWTCCGAWPTISRNSRRCRPSSPRR